MSTDKLRQAITLINSGKKKEAILLLRDVINQEPHNEQAWLWLYSCVDKIDQKIFCLQKALSINPSNADAKKALAGLNAANKQILYNNQIEPSTSVPIKQSEQNTPPRIKHQKPVRQKLKSGNQFTNIAIIIILLFLCVGGTIFGGNWLYNSFLRPDEQFTYIDTPITENYYSEVGVFLLDEYGNFTKMNSKRGEPATDIPQTDNRYPAFILNDPEINPPDLIFGKYRNDGSFQDIAYNLFEENNAYRVDIYNELENGIYCFQQYGALIAPGQANMWCVQIGHNDVLNIDPYTVDIAPPKDGFFILINQIPVELPLHITNEDPINITNLPILPETNESRPILIVQSSTVVFDEILFGGFWGRSGISFEIYDPVVSGLKEGSPAEQADIQPGDILKLVDGEEVPFENLWRNKMNNQISGVYGTYTNLTFQRGTMMVEVTLQRTFDPYIQPYQYEIVQKQNWVYVIPQNLPPNIYCFFIEDKSAIYKIDQKNQFSCFKITG